MIALPLNTPNFTIDVILQYFTHSNSIIWVPWPTNIWYKAHISNINNLTPLTRSCFTSRSLWINKTHWGIHCIISQPWVVVEGNSGQNITFCILNLGHDRRMVYPPSSSKYSKRIFYNSSGTWQSVVKYSFCFRKLIRIGPHKSAFEGKYFISHMIVRQGIEWTTF